MGETVHAHDRMKLEKPADVALQHPHFFVEAPPRSTTMSDDGASSPSVEQKVGRVVINLNRSML